MSYLPPIPKPPNDPTFVLLNEQVGWQAGALASVGINAGTGSVELAELAGTGRSLTEQSGSFGGLVLPSNAAMTANGSVYLLDQASAALKIFDPCACDFAKVPCFGGVGSGPRQLSQPGGIAACGDNLYVCDQYNHRVVVIALRGYVLRDFWEPPAAAGLTNQWQPSSVAFDGRSHAYVGDPANGCVHRFSRVGFWEARFDGLGAVAALAVDCSDRIYVLSAGAATVQIIDCAGRSQGTATAPDAYRTQFPPLPFPVDAQGNLHIVAPAASPPPAGAAAASGAAGGSSASPCGASGGTFDLTGAQVSAPGLKPAYPLIGDYFSAALDSGIYRCQWHRVVLECSIPAGTRVELRTFGAETALPIEQIQGLPDNAWQTRAGILPRVSPGALTNTSAAMPPGWLGHKVWECLVLSAPGRFLWLRLTFRGNGKATPVICAARIEFPRISLRRYLPAVFGADPRSADFTDRMLAIFDTAFRRIEHTIDTQARFFDPMSAPAGKRPGDSHDFLSWIASWIGLSLDQQWPLATRRKMLRDAGKLYAIRGTREGMRRQILVALGMDAASRCCPDDRPRALCTIPPPNCEPPGPIQPCAWEPPPLILEHFRLRRWLFAGASRLGDDAVLWGRSVVGRSQLGENAQVGVTRLNTIPDPFHDPFLVYAHQFTLFVPSRWGATAGAKKALDNLVAAASPAHTLATIAYVAPRMRIGVQASIGLNTVVGRYPEGVTLGHTALRGGSVLGPPAPPPGIQIGEQARVGATTRLT